VQILVNHVLPTFENVTSLVAEAPSSYLNLLGRNLTTALVGGKPRAGKTSKFKSKRETLTITSGSITANVIVPNVPTCGAVVHIIDKLLVPTLDTP
jgi:uncharacterized surface protein with fasciclin (FAS1) repeats